MTEENCISRIIEAFHAGWTIQYIDYDRRAWIFSHRDYDEQCMAPIPSTWTLPPKGSQQKR